MVSDGLWKMSIGHGKNLNSLGTGPDGLSKVSEGLGIVSVCLWKVLNVPGRCQMV